MANADRPPGKGARRFLTTRWSLVQAAGDSQSPEFRDAISDLCEHYWYPVYVYVRRWGANADEAQDLTQGFFSRILEKGTLKAADPERGRFRSFLLAALKFYLADERDRARAQKRGGGQPLFSLDVDVESAEARYEVEADPEQSPDTLFAKRWALEVLEHTHARLLDELERATDPARSKRLAGFLTSQAEETTYREVAEELGMTESAVKVAVHRLRRRFGALLREEVARTVVDPGDVDEELRYLLAAIG